MVKVEGGHVLRRARKRALGGLCLMLISIPALAQQGQTPVSDPLPSSISDPTLPDEGSLLRGSIDPTARDFSVDPLTGNEVDAAEQQPALIRSPTLEGEGDAAEIPSVVEANDAALDDETLTGTIEPMDGQRAGRANRIGAIGADVDMRRIEREGGGEVLREENPYDALGIRLGKSILYPSIETGLEASTNPNRIVGGDDGVRSLSTLRLRGQSDWAEHDARFDGFGTFEKDLSGDREDILRGGLDASLRYDFLDGYALNGGFIWRAERETGSAAAGPTDIVNGPLRHDITGTVGVNRDVGHLRLETEGRLFRQIYGDAELGDGTVRSQGDRNSTLATARVRLGYEVSSALTPFIEGEIGQRYYDEADANGLARDADRYGMRGGVNVDLGEKTRGEIALGWLTERPEDDRLNDVSGLTVDGRIDWSPMRGTLVGLTGTTSVESTTATGESGSLLYALRLNVEREVRHNVTAGLMLGADWRDYMMQDASEQKLLAELNATWWFNRQLGLTSRLSHERFESDLPGRDYDASSIFIGLTARR